MMYSLIPLFSFYVTAISSQEIISSKFHNDDDMILCDVAERIKQGCSSNVVTSRSLVHCISGCGLDKSCIGISRDEDGLCFHHKECPLISGCTQEHEGNLYWNKYCAHGTLNTSSEKCDCVDGFYGERCKQCYTDCRDLIQAGYKEGTHRVFIDPEQNGKNPFLVTCVMSPPDFVSVRIMINRGVNDFNKTWNEYVNGFYYGNDDGWIGLYPWHRLSNAGWNDLVAVFEFPSRSGTLNVYRMYYGVHVFNETKKYSFTIQNVGRLLKQGTPPSGFYFGDCLGPLQDVPFSTWDMDNDEDSSENCAARAGSGWWYTGCDNPCNMMGWGLQYWDTKPRHQVFSLLGVDMSQISSEPWYFRMYITFSRT